MEILITSLKYMTKIRMNQISYLNIISRIFKSLVTMASKVNTARHFSRQSNLDSAHVLKLFCIFITLNKRYRL